MLNLIYPPTCGICGEINHKYLCKKCEINLKKYEINQIKNFKNDEEKYFDYLIKLYQYKDIIRSRIIDYKFNEKSYLYKTFEKLITNNKKICSFLLNYDIILYVPMFKKHKLKRGYNQSKLIAKSLSKALNIKIETNNLIKILDTKKQSTLTKLERQYNIKNAFYIKRPEALKNKKVILFDDIYTTGNTVNECSRVLKLAGVKEITILTLAID